MHTLPTPKDFTAVRDPLREENRKLWHVINNLAGVLAMCADTMRPIDPELAEAMDRSYATQLATEGLIPPEQTPGNA